MNIFIITMKILRIIELFKKNNFDLKFFCDDIFFLLNFDDSVFSSLLIKRKYDTEII